MSCERQLATLCGDRFGGASQLDLGLEQFVPGCAIGGRLAGETNLVL